MVAGLSDHWQLDHSFCSSAHPIPREAAKNEHGCREEKQDGDGENDGRRGNKQTKLMWSILNYTLPLPVSNLQADGKPKPGKDNDPPAKESFKEAFKRLLTNKIFMFNFGSSLFYVFAFMGFGTFMPKYMEYVFKMKGSTSSSFAGGVGTISKAIGLLISGWAISRWKPSARFLSGWNVVLGFMFFASLIVFSMLGKNWR